MRKLHQFYAWLAGYFWLPCPKCDRMFGGHENYYIPPGHLDASGKFVFHPLGNRVWCPLHHDDKILK